MNEYFLRCRESQRPRLLALGVQLGVLIRDEQGQHHAPPGAAWVEVGRICEVVGGTPESPVVACKAAPDGELYWHANLMTPINLRQRAQALAAGNGDIAAALADVDSYFVTDPATGEAVRPAAPAVRFMGVTA